MSLRAALARLLAVAVVIVGLVAVASPAEALTAPALPRQLPAAVDALAPYQGQTGCSTTAQPGTVALRAIVLKAYPGTRDSGMVRGCTVGGKSEHKEGRAWDWGVNFSNQSERAKANSLLSWLLATDARGNRWANARRLGVMYIIWNRHIWGAYKAEAGWQPYTGTNPHTDHVHISLGWPGARQQTSWWTKRPWSPPTTPNTPPPSTSPYPAEPQPLPQPNPVPSGAPLEDEALTVYANSAGGRVSSGVLQRGEQYLVTVTGRFAWGQGYADGECSATSADPGTWLRGRSTDPSRPRADSLDAYLNGYDLAGRPAAAPGDDCDAMTHTYQATFVAATTDRARARIWDAVYADNTGSLRVHIRHMPQLPEVGAPVSLTVDSASAEGVSAPYVVRAGHTYAVLVGGTYEYGNGQADAECATTATDPRWLRSRNLAPGADDPDLLDLKFGSVDLAARPQTDSGGGCDATDHVYTWSWTPERDQQLTAQVYDTTYDDNRGALRVTVSRLA